jgi:hypothetical protein
MGHVTGQLWCKSMINLVVSMGIVEEIESPEAMGSHRGSPTTGSLLRNKGLCWLGWELGVPLWRNGNLTSKWDIKMIYMEYIWLVYNGIMGYWHIKNMGQKPTGLVADRFIPVAPNWWIFHSPSFTGSSSLCPLGHLLGPFVVADLFQHLGVSINGATHHKKNGMSKKNSKIGGTSIYGSRQLCSNHGFLLLKFSRKQTIDCLVVSWILNSKLHVCSYPFEMAGSCNKMRKTEKSDHSCCMLLHQP